MELGWERMTQIRTPLPTRAVMYIVKKGMDSHVCRCSSPGMPVSRQPAVRVSKMFTAATLLAGKKAMTFCRTCVLEGKHNDSDHDKQGVSRLVNRHGLVYVHVPPTNEGSACKFHPNNHTEFAQSTPLQASSQISSAPECTTARRW